jgi:hypothetical protein
MQAQKSPPPKKTQQAPRVLNCLELFAGVRSFGKVAQQLGHLVFSSDFNPLLEDIDYCVDIMQFDPARVPFVPDFVWASPNCATYSIAAGDRHRKKSNGYQPKTPAAMDGDRQIKKTLELLDYFLQQNPQMIFFIENPVGYLQFMPFMQITKDNLFGYKSEYNCLQNARLITIDQCQYGREFQKPTHLWTNSRNFIPRPRCTHKGKEGCHILNGVNNTTNGVTSGGYYKRAMLPPVLFHDIFNQI